MKENANDSDSFKRSMYRWTGISGFAIAIGYVVITILYMISGAPLPKDASSWILYLQGKTYLWWFIIWLSIITDILYIPLAYGLYELLKKEYKGMMLISLVLFSIFVFLELSITWSKYPALLEIVGKYHSTTDNDLRSIYISVIENISIEFQTPVTSFYMIFIPSIAIILSSYVMIKTGICNITISIVGLISGVCNAISVMGGYIFESLEILVLPGSFLQVFWFFGVGITLTKQIKTHST